MNTKFIIAFLLVASVIMFFPSLLYARIILAGVKPVPCTKCAQAPFDGGLSLIIAAGIGIGAKKAYDKKKKKNIIVDK